VKTFIANAESGVGKILPIRTWWAACKTTPRKKGTFEELNATTIRPNSKLMLKRGKSKQTETKVRNMKDICESLNLINSPFWVTSC